MNWVQIRPLLGNWPGGSEPPIFVITADENGDAVIELAWNPQDLRAPSSFLNTPTRYYSTDVPLNATMTNDDGSTRTLNIPMSTSPSSQVIPDAAALQAMGTFFGISLGNMLMYLWRHLPDSDPNRKALAEIFGHPVFREQIPDVNTRAGILKLWLFAGPGGPPPRPSTRSLLPRLLDRQAVTGSNVTQSIVTKLDLRGGKTLVDNLLALLQITPHPDIVAPAQEHLVDDVLTEILDPNGQVNQGEASTCALTSMQTFLITLHPAEYARLQLGLLSASGTIQLANGDTVVVPAAIFQVARYPQAATLAFLVRNYSELAFQATILKYALGPAFPSYDPTTPPNSPTGVNTVFQRTVNVGASSSQMERALKGLFNANFTTHSVQLASDPGWPSYATIQTRQPGLRDSFLRDLPVRQQQLVLVVYWASLPSDPKSGGHAILVIRSEGGRVFFKNPQYAGSSPIPGMVQGGNGTNPPRRFEDPSAALESITETDLATWILWYHTPDQAIL